LIVASVRAALKNGCKHYDDAGVLLTSERDIIVCMREAKVVTIDESQRQQVTTVEDEMRLLGAKV
jgi:hypothetical protein